MVCSAPFSALERMDFIEDSWPCASDESVSTRGFALDWYLATFFALSAVVVKSFSVSAVSAAEVYAVHSAVHMSRKTAILSVAMRVCACVCVSGMRNEIIVLLPFKSAARPPPHVTSARGIREISRSSTPHRKFYSLYTVQYTAHSAVHST